MSVFGCQQRHFRAEFRTRILPDNIWLLNFYKNGHYAYTHSSMWSLKKTVLQRGSYTLNSDTLILTIDWENSTDKRDFPDFILTKNSNTEENALVSYRFMPRWYRPHYRIDPLKDE